MTTPDNVLARLADLESRMRVHDRVAGDPTVRYARSPDAAGLIRLAVVRGLLVPTDPFIEVTFGTLLDSAPWFELPTDDKVTVRTDAPIMMARDYQWFLWTGPATPSPPMQYEAGMIPLPVVNIGGTDVVLHWLRWYMIDPPPEGIGTTDGGNLDAGGNVSYLPGA